MAKTASKRRQKDRRAQERAEQARRDWEARVLEAARASMPRRAVRSRLLLAGFLLLFAVVVLAGVSFAPASIEPGGDVGIMLALITGLTAGGLSCLAVQGGLLATAIAQREREGAATGVAASSAHAAEAAVDGPVGGRVVQDEFAEAVARQRALLVQQTAMQRSATPVVAFLGAKLVAYTVLGAGLGWLGSKLTLTPGMQGAVQVAAALFMVATAMHLLKVHPIFRHVMIQPPRFITRRVRRQARSGDVFAPASLGAMTVFLPCAVTQVMQLAAIGSGSPMRGAAIMFAFVLGTSPLFFGLGVLAQRLGSAMQERFMKVAGVAVIGMALFTLDAGLRLVGSPVSFSAAASAVIATTQPTAATVAADGVQEARITAHPRSYSPSRMTIEAGKPARVVFATEGEYGCTSALVWEGRNVSLSSTPTVFELGPRQAGEEIRYTCSMGMYGGTIEVV